MSTLLPRRGLHPPQMLMEDPHKLYWSFTFSSLHSPLGELGPTQEGATELLHIAHVSIVEVVPCLGRDTQNWDLTLQSHQEQSLGSQPELPESQSETDTGCKAHGPRAKYLQTQNTAQDQPIRTRKVQLEVLDTANWPGRVRSPGTGHSLLVSSLLQSFLLLHCSYSTNSSCSAPKRSSTVPVTAGTPDSITSLEKGAETSWINVTTRVTLPKLNHQIPHGDCQQCIPPKKTQISPVTHLPGGVELVYVVDQVI